MKRAGIFYAQRSFKLKGKAVGTDEQCFAPQTRFQGFGTTSGAVKLIRCSAQTWEKWKQSGTYESSVKTQSSIALHKRLLRASPCHWFVHGAAITLRAPA